MDIQGYSAFILVNGRKVKEYRHNGHTFVEAKHGTAFAIEVKNHSPYRVVAIVSVDGLDVVDGKPATSKSRGYILAPNSAETIHGYRKSQTEVADFLFTTSGASYATDKGVGQNNGVIAIKFIAEDRSHNIPYVLPSQPVARPPVFPQAYYGTAGGNIFGGSVNTCRDMNVVHDSFSYTAFNSSTNAQPASFDMGTTWGKVRQDVVTESEFRYGNEVGEIEFFYASRDALKDMGIPLINVREVSAMPQAFADKKFAQPPSNWRA